MSNDTGNLARRASLVMAAVAGTLLVMAYQPADAQQVPIGSGTPDGVLILRNGNVIQGRIQRAQNHFRVAVEGGEVSVRVSDVEFFCRDLDEAYQRKRAALSPGDARGHVLLAQWCHKQGLLGGAARELDDAVASDPSHPLIPVIQRRIQMSLDPPRIPEAVVRPIRLGPTVDDLDRMVRGMPPGTVETFARTIQPLLNNYCSGAACHGPGSDHKYRLARIPSGGLPSRRTTQRNLHATLQWLDQDDPAASLLLTAPVGAHGPNGVAVFTNRRIAQYGQIANWVHRVAQAPVSVATGWGAGVAAALPETALPGTAAAKGAVPDGVVAEAAVWAVHTAEVAPAIRDRMFGDLTSLTEEVLALENEPVSKLRPTGPKRGGLSRPFVPADLFDPETFNRRFHGPSPPDP